MYYSAICVVATDHQQAESVVDDSLHNSDQLPTNSFTRRLEDVYDRGSILGEGRFAIVWSGINKTSRKEVALKMISRAKVFGHEDIVENELRIMKCVNHPNIIKLIEDFDNDDDITLVMELVQVCGVWCIRYGTAIMGYWAQEDLTNCDSYQVHTCVVELPF